MHANVRDVSALHTIATLSEVDLASEGITLTQQEILRQFLACWDQRKSLMSSIEGEISQLQAEMRRIRIQCMESSEDSRLPAGDVNALEQLRIREDEKRVLIDALRRESESKLISLDQEMGETF